MAKSKKSTNKSRVSAKRSAKAAHTYRRVTKAQVENKLRAFLEANPFSSVSETEVKTSSGLDKAFQISNPWADDSVAILLLREELDEVAAALNAVVLPPRFTAVWHADGKELEVIWTAFELSGSQPEFIGRSFEFNFKGNRYECRFGRASDRLLAIAKYAYPQKISLTDHRNLNSFHLYTHKRADDRRFANIGEPYCFWIKNIEYDENALVELSYNINFHLKYFDARSPRMKIHAPKTSHTGQQKLRFVDGTFPKSMAVKPIDPNVLLFWDAAQDEEPMLAFLLYYRMLEYSAANFLEANVRTELKRILCAPNAGDSVNRTIDQILGRITKKEIDEIPRLKLAVRTLVKPKLVWNELQNNFDFFSKETAFDGGLTMKALVHKDETEEAFCTKPPMDTITDALRRIRNTLSHGKDQETQTMLAPTERNSKLLEPWTHLLSAIVAEVVLYADIT